MENQNKRIYEFIKYHNESLEIFETLNVDLEKAMDQTLKEPEEQAWRRLVIRTALSMIDSVCYRLKQYVLKASAGIERKLSKKQYEFLSEKKIIKTNKGEIRERNIYWPFIENVKRTFKEMAMLFSVDSPDIINGDWELLRNAVNIRNRLTHPKQKADLLISVDDYLSVADAVQWFGELFDRYISLINMK